MAQSWKPDLREFCAAFTHIRGLPNFANYRSPDNYIWFNTTEYVIPGGGVVLILDPDTDVPFRIGVTDDNFAICPGELGRVNISGVVELELEDSWTTTIMQGAKIYLARQVDGSWRATNVEPDIGFFFGRAIFNPDNDYFTAGEAAKSGSRTVQVYFEAGEEIETFGIDDGLISGEIDADVDE